MRLDCHRTILSEAKSSIALYDIPQGDTVKKALYLLALTIFVSFAFAQTYTFDSGDASLDTSLSQINAKAGLNLPKFYDEVSRDWSLPVAYLKETEGLSPAEIYMAAAISFVRKHPYKSVVYFINNNRYNGFAYITRQMGIKPDSKEFNIIKEKAKSKAEILKKWKK